MTGVCCATELLNSFFPSYTASFSCEDVLYRVTGSAASTKKPDVASARNPQDLAFHFPANGFCESFDVANKRGVCALRVADVPAVASCIVQLLWRREPLLCTTKVVAAARNRQPRTITVYSHQRRPGSQLICMVRHDKRPFLEDAIVNPLLHFPTEHPRHQHPFLQGSLRFLTEPSP